MAIISAVRRVIWRGTANPKVTTNNPVLEAVRRMKQVGQEQKKARVPSSVGNLEILEREYKQGRTGFFSCCDATSMKGDDLIVDTGCTDHVMRERAVFTSFESWNEGTTVENPNGTLSRIEGKGSGSGYQGLPRCCEKLHFAQCAVCAELQCELDDCELSCG